MNERRSLKSIALEFHLREKRRDAKAEKKKHKYGARRVGGPNGIWDSQLEKSVHNILLLREKAGDIRNIRRQVTLDLTPLPHRIRLRVDFTFEDCKTGETIACEAKGMDTPEWLLKLKLYRWRGPYKMELWKGSHTNPKLTEIIVPEKGLDSESS